jgi:hypothetical protein
LSVVEKSGYGSCQHHQSHHRRRKPRRQTAGDLIR